MMTKERENLLIRRAQRGDGDAIAELVREHQDALYAFMLRLSGRPEVAEDMVQEAFVRVIQNIDRFDPRFRFSTWTFTIARRLFVNHLQKHRPVSDSDGVEAWASETDRPEDLMAARERRGHLEAILEVAVACLTPLQRDLVTLFHHRSWSIESLSVHFALPEGTVKSHLHRARRRMQDAINRDESLSRRAQEVLE